MARAGVITAVAAAALAAPAAAQGGDPLATILARVRAQAAWGPAEVARGDALVEYALGVLTPAGNFSDIDYTYQQPAVWPAYNHTMRVEWMARSWASPLSAFAGNATFLGLTLRVLDWWLLYAPSHQQSNWWCVGRDVAGPMGAFALLPPRSLSLT
jgi:hypothetical protein